MNSRGNKHQPFIEREFQEVEGGHYDEYGFYYTPNGSFWDADLVYFNKEGLDKHGGYYNDDFEYIPGPEWDEKNQCYLNEFSEAHLDEEYYDEEDDIDDCYGQFAGHYDGGYEDDLLDEEDLLCNDPNIEKITVVENSKQVLYGDNLNYNSRIYEMPVKTENKVKSEEKQINKNNQTDQQKEEPKPKKKNKLDDLFGGGNKTKTEEKQAPQAGAVPSEAGKNTETKQNSKNDNRKSSVNSKNESKQKNQKEAQQNIQKIQNSENSENIQKRINTENIENTEKIEKPTPIEEDSTGNKNKSTHEKEKIPTIIKKNNKLNTAPSNVNDEVTSTENINSSNSNTFEIDPNDFHRKVNISSRESNLIYSESENQIQGTKMQYKNNNNHYKKNANNNFNNFNNNNKFNNRNNFQNMNSQNFQNQGYPQNFNANYQNLGFNNNPNYNNFRNNKNFPQGNFQQGYFPHENYNYPNNVYAGQGNGQYYDQNIAQYNNFDQNNMNYQQNQYYQYQMMQMRHNNMNNQMNSDSIYNIQPQMGGYPYQEETGKLPKAPFNKNGM